jgi:hypothetical protein
VRQYDSLNPKARGRESAEEHAAPWPAAGPLMEGRPTVRQRMTRGDERCTQSSEHAGPARRGTRCQEEFVTDRSTPMRPAVFEGDDAFWFETLRSFSR